MLQTGTRTVEDVNAVGSCNIGDVGTKTSMCSSDVATGKECNINDNNLASENTLKSENGRDAVIIHLKKEIECALKSLQDLQAQMDTLRSEKEEILASEKCSRKSIESLINPAILLRDAIDNFEGELELQVNAMDGKIGKMEEIVQESFSSWFQQREVGCLISTLCF